MYDLVNEPDNKKIFWRARDGRPSLAQLYLDAMDAIHRVQPDAIYVLEVRRGCSVHAWRSCILMPWTRFTKFLCSQTQFTCSR